MRACPHCFSEYVTDVEFCGLDGERIEETNADLLVGKTLDRYEILERLGHGGMSVVYRARHQVIGHEYALKVPYGEISLDRHFSERLRREAQVIAKLDHPNVVRVFDFATTPAGSSFILMELLRGRSLARAIVEDGPMRPATAARLVRQIALGLQAAHRAGFVHRDLKPGNVMLVGNPKAEIAKILDFGLVHVLDVGSVDDTLRSRLTEAGVALGTPLYMAPEQMRGQPATALSDVYSLGAVLYEMLSGLPPYRGKLADLLVKQSTEPPPALPPSGGLEHLTTRMLERNSAKRPQSMDEVLEELDRIERRPQRAIEPAPVRTVRTGRGLRRITTAAAVLLGAVGLVVWLSGGEPQAEERETTYEDVVRSASRTLEALDQELVDGMAELGQRVEEQRAKSCSPKRLTRRLDAATRTIDRAPKRVPDRTVGKLRTRARNLREALVAENVTEQRCRALDRSIFRLERDLATAFEGKRR